MGPEKNQLPNEVDADLVYCLSIFDLVSFSRTSFLLSHVNCLLSLCKVVLHKAVLCFREKSYSIPYQCQWTVGPRGVCWV